MKILHVSAECYPAAKVGGLADVVGALPKYLCDAGVSSAVIIPKYHVKWILSQPWENRFEGRVRLHGHEFWFVIQEYIGTSLGYPLFAVHVPGMFDRDGVYADRVSGRGYGDEIERSLVFQQAVLQWVRQFAVKPAVIHCHDHHTGLIPFMVKHCPEFRVLASVPTVMTIHNGNYSGAFSWRNIENLPFFDLNARGLLDWSNAINPLATGIKCSWACTTVSSNYLNELQSSANGLESLFRAERHKSRGIVNGIDAQVWDPKTDHYLPHKLQNDQIESFKAQNKAIICKAYGLREDLPLITYIGRFADEKGADLLPSVIQRFLFDGGPASFFVLGNGVKNLEHEFAEMAYRLGDRFACALEYNEGLSHLLYAASDFLIMPSRVEPCGLNQLYAMRYGTVPIVRSIGGLVDTVRDMGEDGGYGIRFNHFSVDDCYNALVRSVQVFNHTNSMFILRRRMMSLDHSWERSVSEYIEVYSQWL
jgi:starch synthase